MKSIRFLLILIALLISHAALNARPIKAFDVKSKPMRPLTFSSPLRAKLLSGGSETSVQMTITDNGSGNFSVTTSSVTPSSGDSYIVYTFDVTNVTSSGFTVPNNGSKYWWISFDGGTPPVTLGSGSVSVNCICRNLTGSSNSSGNCSAQVINGSGGSVCIECHANGCLAVCHAEAGVHSGSGTVLVANSINFNGTNYQ